MTFLVVLQVGALRLSVGGTRLEPRSHRMVELRCEPSQSDSGSVTSLPADMTKESAVCLLHLQAGPATHNGHCCPRSADSVACLAELTPPHILSAELVWARYCWEATQFLESLEI